MQTLINVFIGLIVAGVVITFSLFIWGLCVAASKEPPSPEDKS